MEICKTPKTKTNLNYVKTGKSALAHLMPTMLMIEARKNPPRPMVMWKIYPNLEALGNHRSPPEPTKAHGNLKIRPKDI